MRSFAAAAILLSLSALVVGSAQTVGGVRPDPAPANDVVNGALRQMERDWFEIELGPGEFLTCRITSETWFRTPAVRLAPGDRLRVRFKRSADSPCVALAVSLAGDPAEKVAAVTAEDSEWEPLDADDPGPPVLTRRAPGETSPAPRRKPARVTTNPHPEANPEPEARSVAAVSRTRHRDPLIAKAREVNIAFTANLPNFTCRQVIARLRSRDLGKKWKQIDIVEADVLYIDGEEDYRNIRKQGGSPVSKMSAVGGSWSTGEYGTILRNLFHPASRAKFKPVEAGEIRGLRAAVYDLEVARTDSHWEVHFGGRSITPAYRGRIWIEESSGRVLRIEMEAVDLPYDYVLRLIETTLEYGSVLIADKDYLLPVESAVLACRRGSAECQKNTTEFRNYQKFDAASTVFTTESSVDFGGAAEESAAPGAPETPK